MDPQSQNPISNQGQGLTGMPLQPQQNPTPQQQQTPSYPQQPAPQIQQPVSPIVNQPQPSQQAAGNQSPPQLNDELLVSLGLGAMPQADRLEFLEHTRKNLELNVGMKIYEKLQPQQLQEFEGLMPVEDEQGTPIVSPEQAFANCNNWLNLNMPGWQQQPNFAPYASDPSAISSLASMLWLQRNFPNYRDVVAEELNKIIEEIKNNASSILNI
jgi:hypothetical protein